MVWYCILYEYIDIFCISKYWKYTYIQKWYVLYYEISLMWSWNLDELFPGIVFILKSTCGQRNYNENYVNIERRHCRDNVVSAGMISVMTIPRDRMKIQWK